ncbi:4005_t:CDS:2 [Cetraspora pellucida]|uniref:4005_t:CDS:1 n=1 Tax=Cetraspora pellucida TaxID=1433469 RepID=A0ACA9N6P9_9GLOM|nr:4005_t:CDS:2 [Cetraspora pellucida]
MLCSIDTIVKIIQVRETGKDESNFIVVWALGVYPVESEDREMEITLFVPVNEYERDPNVQLVFVKSEYYSVCGKVVTGMYNGKPRLKMTAISSTHLTIRRDLGSNRCPLKALLVGVAQDIPEEIDDESAMFKLLVNDYAGKNYSFVIKEDLYVYAADVSFVVVNSAVKRKVSSLGSSQTTSEVYRSVRSKLLTAHQSSNGKSSQVFLAEADKHLADPVIDGPRSRYTRVEDVDDEDDYSSCSQTVEHDKKFRDSNSEFEKSITSENKEKGKEKMTQPVVHNLRRRV